ncbi:hypothetical protein TNCV_1353851 [Trichonephila clavipes]|nr:hypothetical protein TNCV_1353851 [Trichonephila clavipes]
MLFDRRYFIEAPEIHRGNGLVLGVSLAAALSAIQVTPYDLVWFHLNLESPLWAGQGPFTSLPLPPTSREAARRIFRMLPCHTGTIHLQTPMPSPGFDPDPTALQSVSLTIYTRAFGDGHNGQVTGTTPELAPSSPNYHTTPT